VSNRTVNVLCADALMIVYQEVKQYKEEWEAVMEKLHNVGTVVVYVGKMCQRHGLKKEELPSDLLTVLGTLQRCLFLLTKTFMT
jgi:hypothetical protein